MSLRSSRENSTKTEDKDQPVCSIDDSLQSTFNQHTPMQAFNHRSNKEGPLSCGLEDSFHASLSSIMDDGELSSQPWSPNLSPFQASEALGAEVSQSFDSVGRLSTIDEFGFDSGLLFGARKEIGSRPPSTVRQRPAYKYDDPSSTDLANHRADDYAGSIRKQDIPFELTYSPQRRSCTMAYQESWHQRFPTYGIQAPEERAPISPSATQPAFQRDYITPIVSMRRNSEQNVGTNAQYRSNVVSPTQQSTMSAPCTDSCSRCLEHSTPSPLAPPSSHPGPMHILRSQSEGSILHTWPPQPLDTSVYQFPPPNHQSPDTQGWWNTSTLPNRNLQSYPHGGYPPMAIAPMGQPPQDCISNTTGTGQENRLNLHVNPPSELPHATVPVLPVPPLSCPEAPMAPAYAIDLTHGPSHRPSSFGPSHHSPPLHPSVSRGPAIPSMVSTRTLPTNASHRLPKSRLQNTVHQRRVNQRKASSFPGTSTYKTSRAASTESSTSRIYSAENNNSISGTFRNFGLEDSQILLNGVAPSGSSKTKARREQEAREKRRKLSEAALMAVRQAGGDVEALEAAQNSQAPESTIYTATRTVCEHVELKYFAGNVKGWGIKMMVCAGAPYSIN
ncbi:predicted protein [Uncinocarpus reesii 1704]|uniref:Uncharacterized protein n=1 Tax=Uncinocarpus reesii (strain UAMH 1704) TaxID=336963 RepID=C4JRS2_UNCRE|nr:uncharacterized protein UREG_05161 [Uncinocarpus reesii 1704]EEP80319.1 predicted protein [Uncinocarpus reesii 1704]